MKDSYGNTTNVTATPSPPVQFTLGGAVFYPGAGAYTHPAPVVLTPDMLKQPGVMQAIIDRIVTIVKPREKVIVCFDNDVDWVVSSDLRDMLRDCGIDSVVLHQVKVGVGSPTTPVPEDKRVDILARIGEVWARNPTLKLTDLLCWYTGAQMEDDDFAAAVEVYYEKYKHSWQRP